MDMLKIGLAGIVSVLLAVQLKNTRGDFPIYISIAAGLFMIVYAIGRLSFIIDAINSIQSYITIHSTYISTLIKIIGITYIAEFSSSICRDAGYSSIAGQIEIVSKLTIMALSMPVLLALLETIISFLK